MTAKEYYKSTRMVETRNWTLEMALNFAEEYAEALHKHAVSGSFTIDDVRKAFEGGRDSVDAEIGYEHFGDMEAYPKKKIVKSFKQWMHENYR